MMGESCGAGDTIIAMSNNQSVASPATSGQRHTDEQIHDRSTGARYQIGGRGCW
ncbi:MAG: hypothetical protein ACPGWR_16985 [Ardenticatenaceae bacterium]